MTTLNGAVPEVTVHELSEVEGRELFERACRQRLDVSAARFLEAFDSEDLPPDWPDQDVQAIEFLLPYVR
ncbi:hypothetical protein [Marmoricola sp. RAF53]|uniref:hypothetical protein n=1 Tax=Marmoricola sp. RAF53 TaxID=3233059 RepID=UPI003F9C9153